ncbi:MAG: hypothetical protein ACT6R2_14820, partial [Blastomonas fulva]|uniref:hypothetical protein n=1 Tax=Blastomonas fulva TaxID=1550728 RepID=UPI004033BDED
MTGIVPATGITLRKTLGQPRVSASDQFAVAIRTGGVGGSTVSSTSSSTTAGSGSTVTTGTGTTGFFVANPGVTYTLAELASGTTNLAQYNGILNCTDSNGVQSGLPSNVPFNPAVGFDITPVNGAAIACTISNTVAPLPPTLTKAFSATR